MYNFHNFVRLMKKSRVFSDAFKRSIVRKVESGDSTVSQLCRAYSLHRTCVYLWMKKFGRLPSAPRVVIETESDFILATEQAKKIQKLEQLLGRQELKLAYYEEVIKQASLDCGEDIEKKIGLQ